MAGKKTPRRISAASAAGGAPPVTPRRISAASAAGGAPVTPRRSAADKCPAIPTDEMQYTGRNKDAILYRQLLLAILGKNKDDIKSLQVCKEKSQISEDNIFEISTDLIHSMRPIFQFTPELFGDSLDDMFKSSIKEADKTKIKTEFAKVINMGGRKDTPANGNNFFKVKTKLNPTLINSAYFGNVKEIQIDTFNKGIEVKVNSDIKKGVIDFESLAPAQRLQQNIKDVPFYIVINEMTSSRNPVPHHTLSIICYEGNIYSYGLGAVQLEGGSHIKDFMLDAHISIENIFKNSVYEYKKADGSRPAAILESKFQIVDIGILTSQMVTKLEDYLKNPMGITITSDFEELYGGDFFVYFATDIYVYPSTTYYTYYASTNSLISSCCTTALKALNKTSVYCCGHVKESGENDKLKKLVESGQVGKPKNTSCTSFIADIYGIDCGFCGIADPQGCNRIPQDRLFEIIQIIARNETVGDLLNGLIGQKISDHPYKKKLWMCATGLTMAAAAGLIYYTGMGQGQFKSKKKSKTKNKSKSSKKSKAKTQKKSKAKNKSSKKSRRRLNKF